MKKLFCFLSLVGMHYPAAADAIPRNPYLADSINNQSHWNGAASDSAPISLPQGHYCITPNSFAIAYADALGIPAYSANIGGQQTYWFFSGTALRKLRLVDRQWAEIARQPVTMNLSGYAPLSSEQRAGQARAIAERLTKSDEAGLADYLLRQPNRLISAVEDQVAQGVLYSLFTRDFGFIGANARGLLRIDNLDPKDPMSGLAPPVQTSLSPDLFDDAKVAAGTFFPADSVFGLGMTFNGFLVVSTLGGRIATIDRETLKLIDSHVVGDAELFTNGFATSAELDGGAVYIASNKRMYRFAIDAAGRIHSSEKYGAWAADYDAGIRLPVGKIADGTGATPTLMGFGAGEDKLVILTDGARKMRLVAFWRDGLPAGWKGKKGMPSPRIADQVTVDFGPGYDIVQSEQSVVADKGRAFVLNSILTGGNGGPMPAKGAFIRGALAGTVRSLPKGIAMYNWNHRKKRWDSAWKRTDIGTIATVPMYATGNDMVLVNGTIDNQPGQLFHLGFDAGSGKLKLSIGSGADPRFNGAFTGIKSDDDGTLLYTTMFGLVRFHTDAMRQVASPEISQGGCPADTATAPLP